MATLNIEIDVPIPTGNTLWVDAVNGDDATGVSGRQDRPFLTIQSAISQASAPSTIRIRPGSYQGPIVLKNGVDIECDLGVSITAEINIINTYTISDGGVAATCSITGKPRVFLIEGSAPPAGACLHLSNSASSIFVDIESLVGDTSDTDMGIFLEGGRITGSIGSITTTTYDGIWLAAQNCSVNLEIGSISAGDNPIEVTACSASEIRAGYLSGNGINIVAGNGEDVDVCIVSQRCVMFGQSILSTVNGGSVKAFLSLGQYDAGGGIGFQGLCDGAVISETRIFNSTIPIELSGGVGYQFDGGLVLGCVLVGSGDSIGASTPVSVLSRGSSANTAVGTSVTVEGDLFYDDGADPSGKVSTGNADGTWSWVAPTGGAAWGSIAGTLSAQTDLQSALDTKANKAITIRTYTGATDTLVLADAGNMVRGNNAGDNTCTIPPNASVAFPTGTQILFVQRGAGQMTIAAGSGVTVNSFGSALKLVGQYAQAMVTKVGTDEWSIDGNLTT